MKINLSAIAVVLSIDFLLSSGSAQVPATGAIGSDTVSADADEEFEGYIPETSTTTDFVAAQDYGLPRIQNEDLLVLSGKLIADSQRDFAHLALEVYRGAFTPENRLRMNDLVLALLDYRHYFAYTDSLTSWRALRGHVLLHALMERKDLEDRDVWLAKALALGFYLANFGTARKQDDIVRYARESGLGVFCSSTRRQ